MTAIISEMCYITTAGKQIPVYPSVSDEGVFFSFGGRLPLTNAALFASVHVGIDAKCHIIWPPV